MGVLLSSSATERLEGRKEGCDFCGITQGVGTPLVWQNGRFSVFHDRNPGAKVHLLVIPNAHIGTVACLQPGHEDYQLVLEMVEIGERLVRGLDPQAPIKLGFHLPPWNSVDHLHLHAFGLPHRWPNGLKYNVTAGASLGYITAEQMLERLKPPGGARQPPLAQSPRQAAVCAQCQG